VLFVQDQIYFFLYILLVNNFGLYAFFLSSFGNFDLFDKECVHIPTNAHSSVLDNK
jgi:hypothetical protein